MKIVKAAAGAWKPSDRMKYTFPFSWANKEFDIRSAKKIDNILFIIINLNYEFIQIQALTYYTIPEISYIIHMFLPRSVSSMGSNSLKE